VECFAGQNSAKCFVSLGVSSSSEDSILWSTFQIQSHVMKKISLQVMISRFRQVLIRFPFSLSFIVGFAVLCFMSIQRVNVDIQERLWAFFGLGALLNVAATLYLEDLKNLFQRISLNLLLIIVFAVYCFTLPEKLIEYQYYQLFSMGLVFTLAAFFISFLHKNCEMPFWNFSKQSIVQLIITVVFAAVLYGGLGLAILSLDKLFKIEISSKVYGHLAVFSFLLFAPTYFLSNIPDKIEKRKQEFTFEKIIKIFGLYILLPILAIYTLILYVYLIQIVIKWQLPNGWVSTLVSVLGLGGFLCVLILHPLYLSNKNKVVDLFAKLFPVLLFPLLILMSVGIYRRIADYDLTINRLYVMILNFWFYGISIYLLISKAKQVKWIVISFAAITFLSSIGPWSVFSVTRNTLTAQLEKQLTVLHMLKDGKITPNQTQQKDTASVLRATETVRYLVLTYGAESMQPYFTSSLKDKHVYDILEQMKLNTNDIDINRYFHLYLENDSCIFNTGSYPVFVNLNVFNSESSSERTKNICENSQFKIDLFNADLHVVNKLKNNSTFTIPLRDKIKSLLKYNNQKVSSPEKMTLNAANYKLILKNANGKRNGTKNGIELSNFDAYLFLK